MAGENIEYYVRKEEFLANSIQQLLRISIDDAHFATVMKMISENDNYYCQFIH